MPSSCQHLHNADTDGEYVGKRFIVVFWILDIQKLGHFRRFVGAPNPGALGWGTKSIPPMVPPVTPPVRSLSTQFDNHQIYRNSDPVDQQCHADWLFFNNTLADEDVIAITDGGLPFFNNITADDVSIINTITDDSSSESDQEAPTPHFRDYQKDQWVERFQELQEFQNRIGWLCDEKNVLLDS